MSAPTAYVRQVLSRADGEWVSFGCPRCGGGEHFLPTDRSRPPWTARLAAGGIEVPALCRTGTARGGRSTRVRLVLDWTRAEKVTG